MPGPWRKKRVKEPRAVLSIAFPASGFDLVNRAAEAADVYTSAFVREAALEKARRLMQAPVVLDGIQATASFGLDADHTRTTVSGHTRG